MFTLYCEWFGGTMTGNQVLIGGILFSFLANSERRFANLCGSLHTRNTHSDYDFLYYTVHNPLFLIC